MFSTRNLAWLWFSILSLVELAMWAMWCTLDPLQCSWTGKLQDTRWATQPCPLSCGTHCPAWCLVHFWWDDMVWYGMVWCTFGGTMIVMVSSSTRPRDKRDRRRAAALWGVPSHTLHCNLSTILHTIALCTPRSSLLCRKTVHPDHSIVQIKHKEHT